MEGKEAAFKISVCQDRRIFFGYKKNIAKTVDAPLGSTIHLSCHFCKENDTYDPKVWFFKKRGSNVTMSEIVTEMKSFAESAKISITPPHTLNIKNTDYNDTGIYTCNYFNTNEESIFTYVLDGTFIKNILQKVGNKRDWLSFKRDKLDAINQKFSDSEEEPFKTIRESFKFSFRLIFLWSDWGPCKTSRHYKGTRSRIGKCRLHPVPQVRSHNKEKRSTFFDDGYDVCCRSLQLRNFLPNLSKILGNIPEFVEKESCEVQFAKENSKKTNTGEMLNIKQISENGHMQLLCSETTLDLKVEWYKDNKLLGSAYRNSMVEDEQTHLIIDGYNTLNILRATKNEEGVYTCAINGKEIKRIIVIVLSKSKILSQGFIRYSIYLGFLLSLTMSCYCVGIFVAWHRKNSFWDPLNLNKKH